MKQEEVDELVNELIELRERIRSITDSGLHIDISDDDIGTVNRAIEEIKNPEARP